MFGKRLSSLWHCKAYFDKPQTATLNYIFRFQAEKDFCHQILETFSSYQNYHRQKKGNPARDTLSNLIQRRREGLETWKAPFLIRAGTCMPQV